MANFFAGMPGGPGGLPMPKIPHGLDMFKLFDAARDYALKDDWSCAAGPPPKNPNGLPGLRYGASLEIRPKLVVLPCPCAGGDWNKQWSDSAGKLAPGGLWAKWNTPEPEVHNKTAATPSAPSVEKTDAHGVQKLKSLASLLSLGGVVGAAANGLRNLGGEYHPGSEPYSADWGCATGFKKDTYSLQPTVNPGKRWIGQPNHAELVVATPCPCELGVFTGQQPQLAKKLGEALKAKPFAAVEDGASLEPPKVPMWQQIADTKLGCNGPLILLRSPICAETANGPNALHTTRSQHRKTICGFL